MMSIPRRHRAPRGEFPYAEESVTEAIAKLAPEDRPLASLVQAHAPQQEGARPTFTPRASGPQTRADLAIAADDSGPLSRNARVSLTMRPVIGDSIPVPAPGSSMALGRGWSRYLADARLTDPNRDARDARRAEALHAQHEQGLGRAAAEFLASMRHSRETIGAIFPAVRAEAGDPWWAAELLRRVEMYNARARRQGRGAA